MRLLTDCTFDARDKITDIDVTESGNTTNIDYTYDADGYRTSQTITEPGSAAVTTTYVWDPLTAYGDVIFETDGSVSTERHYTRANGLLLAQQIGTDSTQYLTHDAQGGIRGMLNSTGGSLLESYDYNAFGDFYESPTSMTTKFAYTGQQYDDETGLYFLRARYYDPAIGRLPSQDPYPVNTGNPVELNRYVYTANNPVNYDDPSGLAVAVEDSFLRKMTAYVAGALAPVGAFVAWVFGQITFQFVIAIIVGATIGVVAAYGDEIREGTHRFREGVCKQAKTCSGGDPPRGGLGAIIIAVTTAVAYAVSQLNGFASIQGTQTAEKTDEEEGCDPAALKSWWF